MGRSGGSEKSKARTDVRGSIASVATPSRGGRRDGAGGGSDNKARGPANGLEDLMRRKGVDEAWTALEEMQNQGTSTDKYTVSRMLMKTVGDGRCKINPTRVYRGISLVERFIDTQPKDVDEVLFNALLDTCCRLKDLNRLESTLARMRELNVSPSPVTLGILVKTYGQAGDLQKVLQVWREMEKQRGQANAVTYGCMIDACVKCGHLEKAVEIFKGMRETGKHRNTILYTTLIKGYGLEKDLPSALELFREMPQEGVAYNTITFNSILDACIKCGDLAQAEGLLREMTQSDSSVEPDLITFSTLLKGYCHIGDLDKALQVAESIKARGLNCDELVYNTLMDGCVKANDLAAGIGLFEEMMQSGLRPSAITHSILARLYQRAGYDDAPGSIAQLYQQHGIERPSGGDRGRTGMGPRGNRRARSPSGSTRAGDFSGSGTPLGSPLGSPSGASLRSESLNPFVFEGFDCISAGNSAPATPLNGSPAASPAHRGGAGLFLPPDALRGGCVPPLPGADPCASAVAARWPSVDQSPGANMAAMSPFGAAGGCSFAQAQQALPPFPFQPCGPPAGDAGAQQMQQMIAMPVGSPVGAAGTPAGFGALSEPPHSALSPTSAQPMGTPTGMLQAQHPSFMMPMPGPGDGHFAVQGHAQQAYFDTWGRQQAPQHAPQQLPQMPPQEQQALQEHHMQHMQHQFMQQQMQQQMQQPQQAQQQVEVLRELPRDWVQCRDAQGIFYYNKATQRSSDDLPDELRAPEPAPAPAAHYAQPAAHLQPQYLQQQPQQPQPQPQQQAQPTVHAKVGDWSVCEDDQGIYYFHHPSGRSTEEQPPEVARYLADGRQRPAASAGAPGQHGAHGGQMPHAPSYAPAQSYAAPKPAVVQYSTLGGAGAHYTASGGYGAAAQPYPQQQQRPLHHYGGGAYGQ